MGLSADRGPPAGLLAQKIVSTASEDVTLIVTLSAAAAWRVVTRMRENHAQYLHYLRRGQVPLKELLSVTFNEDFIFKGRTKDASLAHHQRFG